MALGLDLLIWLIPLIVILIAVFILWIVTSIIRNKDFHEMTAEDLAKTQKTKPKGKKKLKN